jgi:hypothetical protein
MRLLAKFSLIFTLVFGVGLAGACYVSNWYLQQIAREQVVHQYDDRNLHLGLNDDWRQKGHKHCLDWYYKEWMGRFKPPAGEGVLQTAQEVRVHRRAAGVGGAGRLLEERKEPRQNLIHDEIRHPLDETRFACL